MKKTIAVAAFLAVMATGSAFATCGTTDGCTPPPPTPVPGSCVGPCGGTFWSSGSMNVEMAGQATAWGNEAQAYSGGTYDMGANFKVNVGGTENNFQNIGDVKLFGGYQGSASGSATQPGVITAGGGAIGSAKWNSFTTFGSSPITVQGPTLPQFPTQPQ